MFFKDMITGMTGIEFGSRSTANKIIENICGGAIYEKEKIIVALSKAIENTINYSVYQALYDDEKDQLREAISNQLLEKANKGPGFLSCSRSDDDPRWHHWRDDSPDQFLVFPKFFRDSTELSKCIQETLSKWLKKKHVIYAEGYFNLIQKVSSAKNENLFHRLPPELMVEVSRFAAGGATIPTQILKNEKLLDLTTEDDASQKGQSFKR
jgi:hypothetical protein